MVLYMLTALSAVISGTGIFVQKFWQRRTIQVKNAASVYLLMMSVFAIGVFYVMNGFSVDVNLYTLVCSAIYGIFAILANVLTLSAMSNMSLLLCSVFQRGSTLLIWLWGVLAMHDSIKAAQVISAVLMTLSILTPLYGEKNCTISKRSLFLGAAIMANGASSSIFLKYYTQNPQKMSDSALCMYTNVLMLGYIIVRFAVSKNRKELADSFKKTKKIHWVVLLGTIGNGVATILSMYVMKRMPISVYSIISSAVGFVIVFINSKVIFREECSSREVVSFLFSALAVLITLIPF